ncbi:MAG: LamG domain-containing protein [Planctomycetes bacterium]|nr:LamG domain-containing protein [Planctomycetota bacterium]
MRRPRTHSWGLTLVLLLAGPACGSIVVDHTCLEVNADGALAEIIPQMYLDRARGLKVLFCHASVGGTIMNGMTARVGLASQNPQRYSIVRQENAEAAWFETNQGIVNISRTDWPRQGSKVRGFDHMIRNLGYGQAGRVNVAFMKFCYIDWQPTTNVQRQWDEYRTVMEALAADYPHVTFVWWTTALNSTGDAGDVMERFNHLVREYCVRNGKVLFDLADIESHDLQGNPCYSDVGAEGLYAGYAVDGAHPTGIGQKRLASAMWWLLARIAGWEVRPTHINVTLGSTVLGANGTAETRVMTRLHDASNHLDIRTPDRTIEFLLHGPGRLTSPTTVTTTGGRAMVTYQAGTSPGTATISAVAAGLTAGSARVTLFANRPPGPPTRLLCDGQSHPTRLSNGFVTLTWLFNDTEIDLGDRQSAYRLLLADNPASLDNDTGNVWDTGKVLSDAPSACPGVAPLRSGARYYWKVKTWDLSGEEGPYSDTATFTLPHGLGYAVNLGGATGGVDFGKDAGLDLYVPAGLTIEMWVYRTEENVECVLLDKFLWSAGGYRIGIDASNHVYFRTRGERRGDRRVVALGTELRKAKWYHVACCQLGPSGSNAGVIYVNGIECGRNGLIYSPWPVAAALQLRPSGTLVDELRLSNTARYIRNFTPPVGLFVADANTVGLWHFDEGEGTIAHDASGHNRTGTIRPGAGWTAGF